MRTRAQAAADRRQLWRSIERDHRRQAREKLASLRVQLRDARARRKQALRDAKERCRAERIAARERARALRIRVLEELREAMRAERQGARSACSVRVGEARSIKNDVERSRAELLAEKKYQADMRRIERANVQRRKEAPRVTRIERQSESDDEVLANISPELHGVFHRLKRGIKATARASRSENFMKWLEEHPSEYLAALDDKTDALIADLQRQQRETRREMRRPVRTARPQYTPEELAAVPF